MESEARAGGLWVAEKRGRLVGYAAFGLVHGELYVKRIGVARAERGRGLGRGLLSTLIRWAAKSDEGLERVVLDVDPRNERAVRLYRSLGFTPEGPEPRPGRSRVMVLKLGAGLTRAGAGHRVNSQPRRCRHGMQGGSKRVRKDRA